MIQREKDEIRRKEGEIQASREDLAIKFTSLGNQSRDKDTILQLNQTNSKLQYQMK